MKVLMLHNRYKILGGEDIQTEAEISLLKQNGIEVEAYYVSNNAIDNINSLKLAFNTVWSKKYYSELYHKIKSEKFDIVHIQNFFPLVSPSIFYAAKKAGAKVVMTVHNYRLICPNALMFIDNKSCSSCVGKTIPYPALFKKCYRGDYSATAAVVAMLGIHNMLHTWNNKIDALICITQFVKNQLLRGGFKENQLHLKYNFVSSDLNPVYDADDYYIYVGRISNEKGINLLLNTFDGLPKKLIIIGEGPLNEKVNEFVSRNPQVSFLGKLSLDETYKKIARAKALIFPSQSNEPFGRTIAEAFAHGTPVIGADIGGVPELVKEGFNGFLFDPLKESGLLQAITQFEERKDHLALRKNAYASFRDHFTPEINYKRILDIYTEVLKSK